MRTSIIAALLLACLAPSPLRADEVVKKDGSSIYGFILADTRSRIILLDHKGRRLRINQSDVEMVIESARTGNERIDEKAKEVDVMDPDELFEVAKWAKQEGELGWRLVAMFALRADDDHRESHELLGHIKVGDEWYEDKDDAEDARKELVAKQRKEEGYVRYKGGWVRKDDRTDVRRNPDDWVLDDDDTWVDKATYMKEKGYIEVNGKFIKAGSPQDKADIEKFKELMGDDIFVYSTEHFRLFMQQYPADQVAEFGELIEKVYDWYKKEMEIPENVDPFRGNQRLFFVFKSKNVALEWYQQFRNRYGLGGTFGTLLNQGGGNILSASSLSVSVRTPGEGQDIRHDLVNHAAHFLIFGHSPSIDSPAGAWVRESFGVLAEEEFLDLGVVLHSTLARYGGSGGMAEKEFTTKSAPDRAKAMVREGIDEDIVTLDKLELNQLSGDHVAKGYTLMKWLFDEEREAFINWFEMRGTHKNLEAMEKAFGRSPHTIDKEWRKYVRKAF